MTMNRVCLIGNLTHDPELRATRNGAQVLNFNLAVNERFKNQQTGEWEHVPCFVPCVMFGARAESVSRYLFKGSKVGVDGRLKYNAWEAEDGTKRSKLEVVIDKLEFLTSRNNDQASAQQGGYQQYQQAPAQQAPVYDEDIPF
ncbi:single-stranded DNA-binding protein [Collinsella sp. AGMB00827]|uniref:Single-stranded DNA-binding protein n=1 Tax=Collinsella ureilytica TaxID=2869515 RepID=A0ABS7MLT0_9ACTN|nr:single-stranded DNA-binding protein [Collinsella urealyticum]MBY4798324.1 single-stranded DNA-binding protein [Collinsella urealyticum]